MVHILISWNKLTSIVHDMDLTQSGLRLHQNRYVSTLNRKQVHKDFIPFHKSIENKMKKKEIEELTTDELKSKIKTLKAILIIMSSLVVLYAFYFVYKLTTGTWEANNTLGIVSMGMLVVVISTTIVRYSSINKILQHRRKGE
jgi:uncharacterized membrane protein YcjF (UPF0283 family)